MFIKVQKTGESFWVEVISAQGEVCNDLVNSDQHGIQQGDVIDISAADIVAIKA